MKKIVPHLWFDTQAKEATARYASLFEHSRINSVTTIPGTPSGDTDIVSFTLADQPFMAISAGPMFKLNPSISFFVVFDSEQEIQKVWDVLAEGGKIMMPYNTYPWAQKYDWVQDAFGVSWQLSYSSPAPTGQRITPMLMFTQDRAGKAKEALEFYTSIFPNSSIDATVPYQQGEGDVEGFLKHARFTLNGQGFMAIDSSQKHDFTFNEAVSLIVNCENQEEIDALWEKLSAVPQAEQCGWLKDKFGVSWQIVPTAMNEMMSRGTKEQIARVTQAFLKMKKFDIKKLEEAFKQA